MRLIKAVSALLFTCACNDLGTPENFAHYPASDANVGTTGPSPTDTLSPGSDSTTPNDVGVNPTTSISPSTGASNSCSVGEPACDAQTPNPGEPAQTEQPGDGTPPATSSSGGDTSVPPPEEATCDDTVGEPVLRRLTARELTNTLSDALGVAITLNLPRDPGNSYGFSTTASTLLPSNTFLEALQTQVHAALEHVDPNMLRERYGACTASTDCDPQVALAFAATLLRRPLSSEETERYATLWSDLTALQTPDDALRSALEAAALSPHALFRSEVGSATATGRSLGSYEIASALAYTFSASAPDAELQQAAAEGSLSDPATRLAHARRLLATERGQAQVLDFFRQWWRYPETQFLAKDVATYPAFTPSIQQGLVAETDRFVLGVFAANGTLSDLLLSRDSELDPELACYYGLAATTDGVARYTRLAGQGIGLLAQGSVLARWALPNSSSPTQRGAFIRRSLLCEPLPAPPPNVGQIPEPVEGVTTRTRYESVHAVSTGCAACHQLTDRVGFAFEHFDGIGQYRATERDLEIDATGELVGHDLTFDGQEELAQALAALPEVRDCLARHWVSFALNVNPEQSARIASNQRCAYESAATSLQDLFANYALSSHFAERRGAP